MVDVFDASVPKVIVPDFKQVKLPLPGHDNQPKGVLRVTDINRSAPLQGDLPALLSEVLVIGLRVNLNVLFRAEDQVPG